MECGIGQKLDFVGVSKIALSCVHANRLDQSGDRRLVCLAACRSLRPLLTTLWNPPALPSLDERLRATRL